MLLVHSLEYCGEPMQYLELDRCSSSVFNNLCLHSSGTESSCHAVAKHKRKLSVTGEGSKGQAETSTNGMSLSKLSPPHSLIRT